MNARVSPIIGRRGSAPLWLGVLLAISLVPVCVRAADPLWINTGTITSAPQVDATNFVNLGTINISTSLPFETSNTRNFTNSGTMTGGPGWFLDNGPAGNGQRSMAGSVVNLNPGVIQSRDSGTLFFCRANRRRQCFGCELLVGYVHQYRQPGDDVGRRERLAEVNRN